MGDWTDLVQWGGWAGLGGIIVSLVTLWVRDRWESRKLGVEQAKVGVQARTVDVAAAEVIVKEQVADAGLFEIATRAYRELIVALREEVDELRERIVGLETREKECQEQVAALQAEVGRLQAALWRIGQAGSSGYDGSK